jgi:hypothetical protein
MAQIAAVPHAVHPGGTGWSLFVGDGILLRKINSALARQAVGAARR